MRRVTAGKRAAVERGATGEGAACDRLLPALNGAIYAFDRAMQAYMGRPVRDLDECAVSIELARKLVREYAAPSRHVTGTRPAGDRRKSGGGAA